MSSATTEKWLGELRGSRPWTETEGRRVIEAWEASGESVAEFARRAGLVAQRVYWWRARVGGGRGEVPAVPGVEAPVPTFLPMTVRGTTQPPLGAAVTVCMGEGLRVEVTELDATSAAWVAALVRSLTERAS